MPNNRAIRTTTLIVLMWIGARSTSLWLNDPFVSATVVSHSHEPEPNAWAGAILRGIAERAIDGDVVLGHHPSRLTVNLQPPHRSSDRQRVVATFVKMTAQPGAIPVLAVTSSERPVNEPLAVAEPVIAGSLMPSASTPAGTYSPTRSSSPVLSAWVIVRPATPENSLATNGQLGASQTGFRLQQPVVQIAGRFVVAANIRVSVPINQARGKEAGVGISIRRASQTPIELIVERRFGIDAGGRSAFALIVAGGFDDRKVAPQTLVSAYGQAGIVGVKQRDGFADGALRVERIFSDVPIRVGAGLWGAAQPSVARLDVGPLVAVKQRLGPANIRLSVEYRWRIAGNARPASGPAISIGTDF